MGFLRSVCPLNHEVSRRVCEGVSVFDVRGFRGRRSGSDFHRLSLVWGLWGRERFSLTHGWGKRGVDLLAGLGMGM